MKRILPILICACLIGCTTQEIQQTMDSLGGGSTPGLSNGEVVSGLKQALEVGTQRAVDVTSVTDGFWKNPLVRIPFPEEAIKVKNTLTDIGMNQVVEDFEMTMNRAAEEATKEAVPVFVNAIKGMSIQDGFDILNGGERAATDFLRNKTGQALAQKFMPVVERATEKVQLTSYWQPVSSAYNTATLLTGGQHVDPDLNTYVTNKAVDGLFVMLAKEETKIRKDPLARTTDLLKKVFGQQN